MDKNPENPQDPSETADDALSQQAPEAADDTQPQQVSETADEALPQQTTDEASQPQPAETANVEAPGEAEPKHLTTEEALAEMRRVLREEENAPKKKGLAATTDRLRKKLFGRKQKKTPAEEQVEVPSRLDALVIPETPVSEAAPAPEAGIAQVPGEEGGQAKPEEEGGAFGSLVRQRLTGPLVEGEKVEPIAPEPEPAELIEEPFFVSPAEEPEPVGPAHSILTGLHEEEQASEEELSTLRQAALEDYVLAPAEEEEEGHTSLPGRLRRSWRYMRPLERRLLIGALMIVGLAVLGGSGFLVAQSLPAPTPTVTPTTSFVPFPISVSLPGGWVFPLSVGAVVDGKWDPQRPEWLAGTEVCRWVSLPWTVQLEAVVRILKPDDEIKLSMSNYDSLTYKIKTTQQVPAAEINTLASDTPCLLVILSKQDSVDRWVVLAKP